LLQSTNPLSYVVRGRTAAIFTGFKIAQIGHAVDHPEPIASQQYGAAREHARPPANASRLTSQLASLRLADGDLACLLTAEDRK
jgi:hypothetical protein